MKILALRGENISSLQEPFEVDFCAEPLASSGLFAISGPTGAGKSTLLDVLCLALYHTTPRLVAAPQRDVLLGEGEDDRMTVSDARNLLSKGAGFGYAEVDYCGLDRVSYRARWSVRRARNHPQGKLQKVAVTVHQLPEHRMLFDSVSEVSKHIGRTVGLTFSEFTRSVLLAQNEFTSFLKATESDKAAILEKLTGVDVFSRLGQHIFERAGQLHKEKEAAQRAMDGVVLLDEEQRLQLQSELDSVTEACKAMRSLCEQIRREQQSLRDREALHGRLEEFRRVTEQTAREGAQAVEFATGSAALLEKTRQDRLSAETSLLAARALDVRISSHNEQSLQKEAACQEARRGYEQSWQEVEHLRKEREIREQILAEISKWKQAHSHVQTWADHWPVIKESLVRADRARHEIAGILRELEAFKLKEKQLIGESQDGESARTTCQAELETLNQRRSTLESQSFADGTGDGKAPLLTLLELEKRRTAAETALQLWRELMGQWETHAEYTKAELLLADGVTKHCKDHERYAAERHRIEEVLRVTETERQQQQVLLERIQLRVSKSVMALRAGLVAGEECPVCGATEHPLGHRDVEQPLRAVLEEVQRALAEIQDRERQSREAFERCKVAEAEAAQALRFGRVRLQGLEELRVELRVKMGIQVQKISEVPHFSRSPEFDFDGSLGVFGAPWDEDHQTMSQRVARAQEQRDRAYALFRKAAEREESLKILMNETRAAELRLHMLVEKQQLLNQNLSLLEVRTQQCKEMLLKLEEQEAADWAQIESLVGSSHSGKWQRELQGQFKETPQEWLARMSAAVAEWRSQDSKAIRVAAEIGELGPSVEAARGRMEERQRQVGLLDADFSRHQQQGAQLHAERQQLFEGRSAREVELLLNAAVSEAEHSFREAENVRRHLESLLAEQRARCAEIQAQILKQNSEAHLRQQDLFSRLRNLDGLSDLWRGQECETKQDADVPKVLEGILQEVERLANTQDQHRLSLSSALDADVRARTEREGLVQQTLALAAESDRWSRLSVLIGCASGNRFRREAQRFTLEVLIRHANFHLESFAPRYQLVLPPMGLHLVVEDLDGGGEQRSVHSLSGGESFLVSLALAMGLSSLSSENVQVESLFIDEGFGSLDAELLNTALRALDALQSQGRKVGVISHVGEMAERIGVQVRVVPLGQGRSRVLVPR